MAEFDDDIVREFLLESLENLERLDRDLVELEAQPTAPALLSSVFRTVHTLKGTCGFLGFSRLESVAHAAESLLSRMRAGEIVLSPDIAGVLIRFADAARSMLAEIGARGNDGDADWSDLVAALRAASGDAPAGAMPAATKPAATPPPATAPKAATRSKAPAPKPRGATRRPKADAPATPDAAEAASPAVSTSTTTSRPRTLLFDPFLKNGRLSQDQVDRAVRQQRFGDRRLLGEILVDQGVLQPHEVLEALSLQGAPSVEEVTKSTIRVDLMLVERLINQVGELVLVRNQIVQVTGGGDDPELAGAAQRLNVITTELQEAVMKTRMQPIGTLWHRMPRVVRDVAAETGKQVHLVLEGGDTELDKSVIEAIRDPLTHLVRNAVDHGIEPPAARMAQGKRAEGRLALRAYHEGGQVLIEIVDDGAGIAVERIRERAIERRLIPTVQIDRMTDRDWLQLIFLPGFSTAERVTNVSGRGVGMDVVKTNLERIGATVELATRPGEGTVFTLRIPLTLAIIPALFVRAGGEEYAIPQVNLLEIVKAGGRGRVRLERVHDAPVIRLRGQLLPIADLGARLVESSPRPDLARTGDSHTIVVVAVERRSIGLVVDEVIGTKEIVVKPVPKALNRSGVFAGATILGDGRVALILDVRGFARWAELGPPPAVQGAASARPPEESFDEAAVGFFAGAEPGPEPAPETPAQPLLLCDLRSDWRVAIPLAQVTRLEELTAEHIERAGTMRVARRRDEMLPLVPLIEALDPNARSAVGAQRVPVVVCRHRGRHVGLVVDRIVEIVETAATADASAARPGVRGSSIVADRVTDILDLDAVLARAVDGMTPAKSAT
jgi:two-component system chemotaxis sensor kinase CheA